MNKNSRKYSRKALLAIEEIAAKYPSGISDVTAINEEARAWLQIKIQQLVTCLKELRFSSKPQLVMELRKNRNWLAHTTENIPDNGKELQKRISFVFDNLEEIRALIETGCPHE